MCPQTHRLCAVVQLNRFQVVQAELIHKRRHPHVHQTNTGTAPRAKRRARTIRQIRTTVRAHSRVAPAPGAHGIARPITAGCLHPVHILRRQAEVMCRRPAKAHTRRQLPKATHPRLQQKARLHRPLQSQSRISSVRRITTGTERIARSLRVRRLNGTRQTHGQHSALYSASDNSYYEILFREVSQSITFLRCWSSDHELLSLKSAACAFLNSRRSASDARGN